MTRSDLPDKWHTLFAGQALGDLTPDEQVVLRQLLQEHPELQSELQAYEAVFAQIPQVSAMALLPRKLEVKILQRGRRPNSSPMQGYFSAIARRRIGQNIRGIGGTILTAAVLLLGWNNY